MRQKLKAARLTLLVVFAVFGAARLLAGDAVTITRNPRQKL